MLRPEIITASSVASFTSTGLDFVWLLVIQNTLQVQEFAPQKTFSYIWS